ncbi:hypothetical protein HDU91_006206 [Kappamyces sp. JEL0680]|nr:hypothetical protein HDU91_006206 [Kappamyces sp. JEL0680]
MTFSAKSKHGVGLFEMDVPPIRPRSHQPLPSLGPLHISVAANAAPLNAAPAEKGAAPVFSEENTHSFIQNTWSTFSTLSDSHRNQLLKGLLSRSSSQQIEFICTCLNIQSLDSGSPANPTPTKVFPESVLGKYLVNARRKPESYHVKGSTSQLASQEEKPDETFKDAMRRAFTSNTSDAALLNPNAYVKLMNSNMDPEALSRQIATASPEGIRFLTHFLSKQSAKFQSVLNSLIDISQQPALEKSAQKLFEVMMDVTEAQYGAIYYSSSPGSPLKVFNNNWPVQRTSVLPENICASEISLKGDLVNIFNLKGSDYYKGRIPSDYEALAPSCILSAPFYGDGLRISGIIEFVNKRSGNPVFSVEDEFMVKALSSITTIIFNQINVKQTVTRKSDNLKTFFAATNATPAAKVEMGDLIGVIMKTARDLVTAERCTIFLYDEERDELWSKVAQGSSEEIRFPSSSGLAGFVFQSGQICNTQDAYADPRFNQDVDLRSGFKTRTILTVPMYSPDNEVIGVMQAVNKIPAGFVFDGDDMVQLQSFAALSASTLQKSNEIIHLTDMVAEQRLALQYNKSLVHSMQSTIISIDTDGRANTIENIGLIGMEKMTDIMRSTSFENWLGRDNFSLSDSILHVHLTGEPVTVYNYPFQIGRFKQRVSYHICRLVASDAHRDGPKGRGDGSRRSSRLIRKNSGLDAGPAPISSLITGLLLVITPTTPNRFLIEQLGRYAEQTHSSQMDPKLLAELLDQPDKLNGEYQPVTVVVVDIRRCVITDSKADQAIIGFGLPCPTPNDSHRAIECTLAIKKEVEELNKKIEEDGIPPFLVSIGVSTSIGLTAAIGAAKLKKYAIMGAPVDEAEALQGIAKVYGAGILVDQTTKDVAKENYHIRELDTINKSRHSSFTLFEIMSATNSDPNHDMMTTIVSYELGLAEYRSKNWQAAIMHFKKSQTITDDHPSKYMIERCRALIDGRLDLPEEWNGSWNL